MRLLQRLPNNDSFSLVEYVGKDIPQYAILSHTWGLDDDEVTFKDVMADRGKDKPGYRKLSFCSKQAAKDGLKYFWVDTCCIDKTSSAEMSEAINSMFKWYQDAKKCYVFLSDVSVSSSVTEFTQEEWGRIFQGSRWFKRGWTLQELLAPRSVEFFSGNEEWIGDKISLQQAIHATTGLPLPALENSTLLKFSVDERMSWAERRETKREEDAAYSLLGIFDIQMPLIYGEGRKKAFARLRKEIDGSAEVQLLEKPRPAWTVPFGRDADFVSRESLDRVYQICAQPAGRASLVGLGGIGKSQIAIEYTYRVRDRSPSKWVFWVHAGTRARFEEGYCRIAEATKMDGRDDPKVNILKLVRSWLCDESNGQWTMVVDNADDSTVFSHKTSQNYMVNSSEQPAEPLFDYLPQSPNGSVLITSRNQALAEMLTGTYSRVIQVMPMHENDALALLDKKLGFAAPKDKAVELVNLLEAMPLALTQAAAFIRQRAPRMSVTKYLDDVRRSDRDHARLLEKDVGDSRRDSQASNSIISTWRISFEHIHIHMPTAAHLLSLMSMFDRQGIPESLLQDYYNGDQEEEADFDDDIQTLSSFSLVQMSADGSEFEMHRLVQLATKKWLELHNKLEAWAGTFATLMEANYPEGEYENWPVCQALFPHVQALISNKPKEAKALEAWASVLFNASLYLQNMGQYNKALELNTVSLQIRESILGPEHPKTLESLDVSGIILASQGRHIEAEAIDRRALVAKKKVLGEDHEKTFDSMEYLASTYRYQGQYREAEELEVEVLQMRKTKLGGDHPKTLTSMENLASTYIGQGRYKEAQELQVEVLQMRKLKLGGDHPNTLVSIGSLASTYSYQGRYKEAEELQVEVLQMRKTKLGGDHPKTLTSMENLASTYRYQGRYEEAEELQVEVLQMRKLKLGGDHPKTLISMGNLALTYSYQVRYKEAEELQVEVLQMYKKKLGENHPQTLAIMNNLAHIWKDTGRHIEAIDLMRRCVELRRRVVGVDHPKTKSSEESLAFWEAEEADATTPKEDSASEDETYG